MYLAHFGLREAPFRITPHTELFFPGADRGATLDALAYALTQDEGMVKVTGEVGTGKTMLCRMLMERLPNSVQTVYLANPSLSPTDILFAIAEELGIELAGNQRAGLVLRRIQHHLIELYRTGRRVAVLIDEAHAMPLETLEEVRLLSNLESSRHRLLQIVLFGQPELNGILARPEIRQLKERITHSFVLQPMGREDIQQYLAFRMKACGYSGAEIFTPGAVKAIADASHGLGRRVNILAEKALLCAFTQDARQITALHVKSALQDAVFAEGKTWRNTRNLVLGGVAATVLVAVLLWQARTIGTAPSQEAVALPLPPTPGPRAGAETPAVAATPVPTPPSPALPPAPSPTPTVSTSPVRNPLLALPPGQRGKELMQQTKEWIAKSDGNRWFLQLARLEGEQQAAVENLLGVLAPLNLAYPVGAYRVEVGGQPRMGVILGDFATAEAASAAAQNLPRSVRELHPYPRQIKRLR